MEFVEPIRDRHRLDDMFAYFDKQIDRDRMLFFLGINTGLRISDILPLRVLDVKGKKSIRIKEIKTGKLKDFELFPHVIKEIAKYIDGMDDNEYLFKATRRKVNRPLSRQMAWKIIKRAADYCGIRNIGCHSLRKTFGYHFYKQNKDVVVLMKLFNHHDQHVTLRYIGVERDELNENLRKFGGFRF